MFVPSASRVLLLAIAALSSVGQGREAMGWPSVHPGVVDCPSIKLVWQPTWSQINATAAPLSRPHVGEGQPRGPGSAEGGRSSNIHGVSSNKYGLEDGIVVRKADGTFSMVATEMYADPKWVATRLGVYMSEDGLAWRRLRGLRRSTTSPNPPRPANGMSPHAATWGPFFLHDPSNDTWLLSYVGYRSAPSNSSGWLENFDGTIFARYADVAGDAGLDGNFGNDDGIAPHFDGDVVLIGPDDFHVNGPWPHPCQGMQGTDSFYPFQLVDGSW